MKAISYLWNIPVEALPNGEYILQANFIEETLYLACSDTTSPNNLFVVPEYLFGSLAAVGACFAAFLFFKKRSNLPQLHFK